MCVLCASKISGQKCTWSDPYAGDEGAFKCLIESGDIAFLRHTTVLEMVKDESLFSKESSFLFIFFKCDDLWIKMYSSNKRRQLRTVMFGWL